MWTVRERAVGGGGTFCFFVIASPAKPGVAIQLDCFVAPLCGAPRNDKTDHGELRAGGLARAKKRLRVAAEP
jgi:hypothetical protein